MRFIYLILLVLIGFPTHILSQSKLPGKVKGRLIDSISLQNIKNATLSVLKRADSSLAGFGLSKDDGSFQIENLPFGDYILTVTSVGFNDSSQTFSLTARNPVHDAGNVYLFRNARMLGEVIVKAPLLVVNGDTTEFNAAQVKTIPNATVEDVLKKLPGLEVEKDGSVKAQGENVTRVLVNGKRFFGDDAKMATKNIPAEIIDKIQVIDALSEQSAFSGFDDGNRVKTINIVTKKDKNRGVFGKAVASAGNKGRFAEAASMNRFNGNQQISFVGQGNNVNSQNFSVQDFLGSMNTGGNTRNRGGVPNVFNSNSSGISTTFAAGLNYNDVWGTKTLVNGSYFFNSINSINNRDRFRETFVTGDSSLFNRNQFYSANNNKNHRFNFEIDHRFDSSNSLLIRPSLSYQNTDANSETHSYTTRGKLIPLNEVMSTATSENHGYNFNNSILFRHQFRKTGRTFSVNLVQGMNTNDRHGTNLSYSNNYNRVDTVDQITSTIRDGKNLGVNVSLTERIGVKSQVELTYNYNYTKNNSDQQTYRFDTISRVYDVVVPNLTNLFENTNISQRAGVNYRLHMNSGWNYSVGMAVQHADLTSNNHTKSSLLSQSFYNLFPFFQIQFQKTRAKNLRFNYRGNTQQPSITQLQDVIDNRNVLHIRSGNPGLKQEFANNFSLIYNAVNIPKSRFLTINLNGNSLTNKIANTNTINTNHDSIIIDGYKIGPGVQFSKPRNLNGAFSFGGSINYSFPFKSPKSRINISARTNYNRDVNLINGIKTYTNNYVFGNGIRFTMNLDEKIDLNFSSNTTYNIVRYTDGNGQNGDYLTQRFSIEPTWSTKSGWILSNDFDYLLNRGQATGFNQSIPLWNAGVAKLFTKKKEAELRFTLVDILNQNKSITRNIEENYIEDVRTRVLTRYFLVSFTYYLRKFKGRQPRMNNYPGFDRFNGERNNNFNERRIRN